MPIPAAVVDTAWSTPLPPPPSPPLRQPAPSRCLEQPLTPSHTPPIAPRPRGAVAPWIEVGLGCPRCAVGWCTDPPVGKERERRWREGR